VIAVRQQHDSMARYNHRSFSFSFLRSMSGVKSAVNRSRDADVLPATPWRHLQMSQRRQAEKWASDPIIECPVRRDCSGQ